MSIRKAIAAAAVTAVLALGAGCEEEPEVDGVEEVAAPVPAAAGEATAEVDVEEAAGNVAEVAAPVPGAAAEAVDEDVEEAAEEGE